MSRVFLSYPNQDRRIADKLVGELELAGVKVSWDVNVKAGTNWRHELTRARERADAVVVLMSPAGLSSAEMAKEWSSSLDRSQKVIPALTGGVRFADLPSRLAGSTGVNLDDDYSLAVHQIVDAVSGSSDITPPRESSNAPRLLLLRAARPPFTATAAQ